jgi:4-amino-4-deoxy-L-arabinose transferase
MWQMALSMKAFGVSIFAARLPSIIMGALMVPMLYHLCRLMRCSHFTAITAAAMHCVSYYHLEHVSGYAGMDHNDVAFSFYILASIWAYAFYLDKRTWNWVVLIGVFAGCAILCKWLVGLLVYAGWGIALLCSIRERSFWQQTLRMLASLGVTVAVALPWQLYILSRFPLEARYEYAHASRHIGEVVEGHGGAWDYYFDFFPKYFGDTIFWLIPVGILLLLLNRQLLRPLRIAICAMMLVAIVFYSFIAQTKIYSYLMPVVPLGYIAIAYCADSVLQLARRIPRLRIALSIIVFLLFCNLSLQWGEIQSCHKADDAERVTMTANTAIYKDLHRYLKPGTAVVVNLPAWDDIDVMFFKPQFARARILPEP